MNDTTLSKTYDPDSIEQPLYHEWEESGCFTPQGEQKEAYCISIPPPNVTGRLHMGHAFQDTIMDALIRYHRMKGRPTLWQAGSDHAGIATQMVVERQLEAEGSSRHDLGREAFIERIWEWKKHSGNTITQQLRRMGASLDWSRERFTMDEGLSDAVGEVFIRLYREGLIYRGKRLVNWDPVLHTAVSDLEVISEEESGHLWHLRYPRTDGKGHVVVATTRPETMLGDAAIAVHPLDQRYLDLIGKSVKLPLTAREIPVIADDYVDPEFGSGCVKITPAHDFNDYEVGQRHQLDLINVMTIDAAITLPDSPYDGMDRYDARKQIVTDLTALGLVEKRDDHRLMVPRGDRSGSIIEPYLTDQWYVKVAPLAEEAVKAVESGKIRFVPDNWSRTYYEWMNNIQDWCISRQIWWGHRIPAWYDEEGNVYVAETQADALQQAKKHHGSPVSLRQDEDVLDTWFSSALWPFSTLGWPDETPEFNTFYPTNVLVTGFDIIFFWVARMIMFGLKFTDQVPFHDVYVHGLIRDAEGQKMSKSKGNVLDPLDLIDGIELEDLIAKRTTGMMQPHLAKQIEESTRKHFSQGIPAYGTDALRITFASLATQGRDIRFDLGRIEGFRNFCNKLWNASRYVLMNSEEMDCGQSGSEYKLGTIDHWMISRLQQTEASVEEDIGNYRFDRMALTLHSFIWDEYCSWYLEFSKVVLNDSNISEPRKTGTRRTLVRVLEASLRLLHPLMPFITDTLWRRIAPLAAKTGDTVMLQPFPEADLQRIDQDALDEIAWIQEVVTGVRTIRGEMNIEPGKPLPLLLQNLSTQDHGYLKENTTTLSQLARLEMITLLGDEEEAPESATALVGRMKVLVPLGSVIDAGAEIKRLDKEIDRVTHEINRVKGKLDNPHFIEKAPPEIVSKERQRQSELENRLDDLKSQYQRIQSLATE
jgi:valyl-tRNA synthetase|tara:strand:- start:4210 stop:7005 length:2796 start_codon:yes stop_codon:yes gene_type:complete